MNVSTKKCRKRNCKTLVNLEDFINITKPEIAYILGFIWGDGSIGIHKNQNSAWIKIGINSKDQKDINNAIQKTGKWNCNSRVIKKNYPENFYSMFASYDKRLYDFLCELNYSSKENNYDKILARIPDELKHYWWRGLMDADGCIFFIENKQTSYGICIASSYNQNWESAENLFKNLNIRYRIQKRENKKENKVHRNSTINIGQYTDIIKFGNFIYRNYETDGIGLKRKRDKFLQIVNYESRVTPASLCRRNENGDIELIDLTGKIFDRWKVISESESGKEIGQRRWNCECICGTKTTVFQHSLIAKKSRSCGCYVNEESRKEAAIRMSKLTRIHGESHTLFYDIWYRMNYRYSDSNSDRSKKNLEKGITVCEKWQKYENFKEDMQLEYLSLAKENSKIVLMRKNKKQGFFKENCFWQIQKSKTRDLDFYSTKSI